MHDRVLLACVFDWYKSQIVNSSCSKELKKYATLGQLATLPDFVFFASDMGSEAKIHHFGQVIFNKILWSEGSTILSIHTYMLFFIFSNKKIRIR